MNRDLEIFYGDCRVGLFGITEQAEYYIAYDDDKWMSRGFPGSHPQSEFSYYFHRVYAFPVSLPVSAQAYRGLRNARN